MFEAKGKDVPTLTKSVTSRQMARLDWDREPSHESGHAVGRESDVESRSLC
jgi:hypothetical protein